jgi:hypothetical protein
MCGGTAGILASAPARRVKNNSGEYCFQVVVVFGAAASDMHLLLLCWQVNAIRDLGNARSHPVQDITLKLAALKNASAIRVEKCQCYQG